MCHIIGLRVDKEASCNNFEARVDMIKRPSTEEYFLCKEYKRQRYSPTMAQILDRIKAEIVDL